jgi:hypothetical protein
MGTSPSAIVYRPTIRLVAAPRYGESPISISMQRSVLAREIIFDVIFEGIAIFALVVGVLQRPINPAELLVFVLVTFMVMAASRVPFITTVDGDELTTKGLRGRKTISLSSVAGVKAVAGSRWDPCLKITDSNDRLVFLALRSVAKGDRVKIQSRLEESLLDFVSENKRCMKVWSGWFGTRIQVTRTITIRKSLDS